MEKYDYFKFLFVILLTVGFVMQIGIIKEQRIDNEELIQNWNKSLQVSNDLLYIVKEKQLNIDNLNNQAEFQINQYKILLDKNKNISEEYNTLFNDYKRDVVVDTMIIRPTYQQVVSFLSRDHTDIKTHIDSYNCVDFSNELTAHARDEGLFACASSIVMLNEGGHRLVAFNTIDRGLIYVEPQNDNIMTKDFGVGSIYWDSKVVRINSCWGVIDE